MSRYYRLPFATNGDREDLEDETANSLVSYATGFTQDYQRNPATDSLARRPERTLFNDLHFEITDTLREYYEHGVPPFINSADNNGSPFPYTEGARVLFNDRVYESTTDNNITDPSNTTNWNPIDLTGLDARFFSRSAADGRFLRQSENLNDLDNAATARNNLDLGTAATANTGTTDNDVPTITQADNRYYTQTAADSQFLQISNNLSDLDNPLQARVNLELGTASRANTGINSFDVPTTAEADDRYVRESNAYGGDIASTSSESGSFMVQAGSNGIVMLSLSMSGSRTRSENTRLSVTFGSTTKDARVSTDDNNIVSSTATVHMTMTGLTANSEHTVSWTKVGPGLTNERNTNGAWIGV